MNSNFSLRDYRKNDYPEVKQLWEKTDMGGSFRGDDEQVIEQTIQSGGKLLILEDTETKEIIGTSWLTCDGRRIYLHHFGIQPEHQGNGFSKPLLKATLEFAKNAEMQIKIEVHKNNSKAINLYLKSGFKYLGDYDVYIIRDFNTIK